MCFFIAEMTEIKENTDLSEVAMDAAQNQDQNTEGVTLKTEINEENKVTLKTKIPKKRKGGFGLKYGNACK